MWAAWGILGFVMIASPRYLLAFSWKYNMWIHVVAGIIILVFTLIWGILAINYFYGTILNEPHAIIGFMILIAVGILCIVGLITRVEQWVMTWKTRVMLAFRFFHKVSIWYPLIYTIQKLRIYFVISNLFCYSTSAT